MAKSKELKEYDDRQWEDCKKFEDALEAKRDELLDGRRIEDLEPAEYVKVQQQLKRFINKEHPERGYYVKYSNFILDVRKPSFGCFILFCILTIIGLISVLKWIF